MSELQVLLWRSPQALRCVGAYRVLNLHARDFHERLTFWGHDLAVRRSVSVIEPCDKRDVIEMKNADTGFRFVTVFRRL